MRTGRAEIVALLQKRKPSLGSDPDIAWETIDNKLRLQNPATLGEWSGEFDLMVPGPFPANTFRILLQEQEWYRSDFKEENFDGETTAASRIVYAGGNPIGLRYLPLNNSSQPRAADRSDAALVLRG